MASIKNIQFNPVTRQEDRRQTQAISEAGQATGGDGQLGDWEKVEGEERKRVEI